MGETLRPEENRKLMFTRCPECRTVFHITAAELRAADGTVVCGACDTTFDALESLSETRPADAPPDEPDEPLAQDPPPEAGEAARDEDEFLEELESLIGNDDTPEELPHVARPVPATFAPSGLDVSPDDEPDDFLDDDLPDPDSVFRVDEAPEAFDTPLDGPFVAADDEGPGDAPVRTDGAPDASADEDAHAAAPADPSAGHDEGGPQEPDARDDVASLPGFARPDGLGRPGLRVALPLAAVLFLAGTWAHVQSGKLMRLPAGQAVLGPIYSLLGMDVAPDWRPGEFRVLRSEAIATADQSGDLNVAIEFQNGADFAQPYPEIRIVLQDRFGQRVATHDFGPDQYLDGDAAGDRLGAGERIRTSVSMPDPGARADGFRVDLCLELDARGLVCAAEPFR